MAKYCSENEKVKRAYTFYLEAASGKQNATIDSALRAIARFEESTGSKPFSKFGVEQARSFRARLVEPGLPFFRCLTKALAKYFNPSEQDRRIAGARREGHVPTLEDIKRVLNALPSQSPVEKRDRALVAYFQGPAMAPWSPFGSSTLTSQRGRFFRTAGKSKQSGERPSRPTFSRSDLNRLRSLLTM
jgi:hypothetical protein